MSRRILITGSRDWWDHGTVSKALANQVLISDDDTIVVIHGGAHGADDCAKTWVQSNTHVAMEVEVRANWVLECGPDCVKHRRWRFDGTTYCPRQGNLRNQRMVDLGADICLAFPLETSRGTWDCMRRAEKAGIEVLNLGYQR